MIENMDQNKDIIIPDTEKNIMSADAMYIMPIDAQALIAQAIDKNTPIEIIEKLLAMRRELKAEAAKVEYFRSLTKLQMEIPIIEKKNPVYNKDGKLMYKYATLDDIITQVRPILEKHGFSYIIKTRQDEKSVTAICQTYHRFGHWEDSSFTVPVDFGAYMNMAQKFASALTFAKRYTFCDAFGIITATGDDDGRYSGAEKQKRKNQPKGSITFNNAPEKNKGMYQTVMVLIREKCEKQDLFSIKEKTENKKKADAVIGNYDALIELYKVINKIAQDRRNKIRGKGNL